VVFNLIGHTTPYAQTRLCCPCLHHFRATPTSLCPLQCLTELITLAHCLLQVGVLQRRWDLRSYLRNLSPHATGLTPGPPQEPVPFSSLRTMAFSIVVEDRRIACYKQVYPAPGLSQLYPSGVSLRGCTIRFMLRPAALAGIPDWVKPMPLIQWQRPSRHRVGASSARALPHEPAPSLHIQKGN